MDYQDWYSTFVEAPRTAVKKPVICKKCGAIIRVTQSTNKLCKC